MEPPAKKGRISRSAVHDEFKEEHFSYRIGDYNGYVGLGVKCSKEVATTIRGAIILAKFSIVPLTPT